MDLGGGFYGERGEYELELILTAFVMDFRFVVRI